MPISNAEKQARFRKKEQLLKLADEIFREIQVMRLPGARRESPDEIRHLLVAASTLPPKWGDEDVAAATDRLSQLRADFTSPQDDLNTDILLGLGLFDADGNAVLDDALFVESKQPLAKTRALASHMISALTISDLSPSEQAASVLEVARYLGRSTVNADDTLKSYSTAVCLASLPNYFDRPEWCVEYLAGWLKRHLGEDEVQQLKKRLV